MKNKYKIKMEIFNNNNATSYLLTETYLDDAVNYEEAMRAIDTNREC